MSLILRTFQSTHQASPSVFRPALAAAAFRHLGVSQGRQFHIPATPGFGGEGNEAADRRISGIHGWDASPRPLGLKHHHPPPPQPQVPHPSSLDPTHHAEAGLLYEALRGKLPGGEHHHHKHTPKFELDDPRDVVHHSEEDMGFATGEGIEGWVPSRHPRPRAIPHVPPPDPFDLPPDARHPSMFAEGGVLEGLSGKLHGGEHHYHRRTPKFELDDPRDVVHRDELDAGYAEAEKARVGPSPHHPGLHQGRAKAGVPEPSEPHPEHERYAGADHLLDLKKKRVDHFPAPENGVQEPAVNAEKWTIHKYPYDRQAL